MQCLAFVILTRDHHLICRDGLPAQPPFFSQYLHCFQHVCVGDNMSDLVLPGSSLYIYGGHKKLLPCEQSLFVQGRRRSADTAKPFQQRH